MRPERLVDINALAGPHGAVEAGGGGLRLGALARMADVADHPAVKRDYPGSRRAWRWPPARGSATWPPSAATCSSGRGAPTSATPPGRPATNASWARAAQHHHPIELFTTTASWSDGKLTVHEPSQFVYGLRNGVAKQLGMDPDDVRVVSEYIGGAFGSKGAPTQRTALIPLAAKRLGRPVKLVATRDQGFTIATCRAETRHHVKLSAERDGKLQALVHEGMEVTSRPDPYRVGGHTTTSRMYACPNIRTKVSVVHADRNTPGFMRSPPEVPYMFALESAMDELAHALKMDPVELRRVNDTQREPVSGFPYTSRSLMACYNAAGRAFDWGERNPEPRSMRQGEWLVGWGCATAVYPTAVGAAAVRVTLAPQGHARVQTAGHETGNGLYTVLAVLASEQLGLPVGTIAVEMADTELPPAPVAGGSTSTASLGNALALTCEQIRARVADAAAGAADGPLKGRDPASLRFATARCAPRTARASRSTGPWDARPTARSRPTRNGCPRAPPRRDADAAPGHAGPGRRAGRRGQGHGRLRRRVRRGARPRAHGGGPRAAHGGHLRRGAHR